MLVKKFFALITLVMITFIVLFSASSYSKAKTKELLEE